MLVPITSFTGLLPSRASGLPTKTRRVILLSSLMPPPLQQEASYEEGRIDLARQAYEQGKFQTPGAAAKSFDVKPKKLKRRIAGIQPRRGSIAKNRLLMPTEEESLVQWILLQDKRGMLPNATEAYYRMADDRPFTQSTRSTSLRRQKLGKYLSQPRREDQIEVQPQVRPPAS